MLPIFICCSFIQSPFWIVFINSSSFSVIYFQITSSFAFLSFRERYRHRYIHIYLKGTYLIYTHSLMTCNLHFSQVIASFRTSSAILNCDVDSGHSYFSQRSISLKFTEKKHIVFFHYFFILSIWLISTFNFINWFPLFSLCILILFSAL